MPLMRTPEVVFDPRNTDHVASVQRTLKSGKLDSAFRFHLEEPFTSTMTMCLHKMAMCWAEHLVPLTSGCEGSGSRSAEVLKLPARVTHKGLSDRSLQQETVESA